MLNETQIKRAGVIATRSEKNGDSPVLQAVEIAKAVSLMVQKRHRYFCGLESLEISDSKWSYRGVEQPNPKARGFFLSPDSQNGEFYWMLRAAGFQHHFRMAEYHWGVRKGNIILTYTEGDVDVFEEPVGYKSPKS